MFWSLDTIKGSPLQRELNDIESIFALNSFKSLRERTDVPLTSLLNKAVNETDFYNEYHGYKSLSDFPVVDKNIINSNFEKFVIKSSAREKVYKAYTSGSTGTPFMVFQNRLKKTRNTADTIFFAQKAGFSIGDKLLYTRMWSNQLKKNKITAFLQNIVPINVEDLNDDYIEKLLMKLERDRTPKGWLGYPSGLEKICDYLDRNNSKSLDCNIRSIIGMSENLSDHVRSRMWYYFNAPMVSRYSNLENGIIAQQAIDSEHFVINWASYIVEIMDFDKDEPVKEGQLGRIVITDLYNHAIPMIRYNTGDIGAFAQKSAYKFPVLKTVEGRKADILYDTSGKMISAYTFMGLSVEFPEIKQIQFLQTHAKHFVVKLNTIKPFAGELKLRQRCHEVIGLDANIEFQYVNEIPLLNSKKRKITKNLMMHDDQQSLRQLVN